MKQCHLHTPAKAPLSALSRHQSGCTSVSSRSALSAALLSCTPVSVYQMEHIATEHHHMNLPTSLQAFPLSLSDCVALTRFKSPPTPSPLTIQLAVPLSRSTQPTSNKTLPSIKEKPTWWTIYLQYISSNTSTCFGRIYSPSSGGTQRGYNS